MGKNKTPHFSVRLTQEQYNWFMEYVVRTNTNPNALVRELVQDRMLEDKNFQGK